MLPVLVAPPPGRYGADDTAPLQDAIHEAATLGRELRIRGSYTVSSTGLTVPANARIVGEGGARLSLAPHEARHYQILRIHDVGNVHVEGLDIDGRRGLNAASTGEWGMGISVRGCTGPVTLRRNRTINCWGDGFYVGASTTGGLASNENVLIEQHYADNCRRNGGSLISAKVFTLRDSMLLGSNGTNPQACFGIEPNTANDRLDLVRVERLQTGGAAGTGAYINLDKYAGASREVDIRFTGHRDDGSRGGFGVAGANFGPGVRGIVQSTDAVWMNTGFAGFSADRWAADGLPARIVRPTVIDSNRLEPPQARFNSPYAIFRPSDDRSGNTYDIGGVDLVEPSLVMRERRVARTFYVRDEQGGTPRNIRITDPRQLSMGSSDAGAIRARLEGLVEVSDRFGVWRESRTSGFTAASNSYVAHDRMTNRATAVVQLEASQAGAPDRTVEVDGSGPVQVKPPPGGRFEGQPVDAFYQSSAIGSHIRVRARGPNVYRVIELVGAWSTSS